MKKKNIAFILFAVAAVNLIGIPFIFSGFTPLYESLGMSTSASSRILTIIAISSLIPVFVLVVVGIILLIKFRNE